MKNGRSTSVSFSLCFSHAKAIKNCSRYLQIQRCLCEAEQMFSLSALLLVHSSPALVQIHCCLLFSGECFKWYCCQSFGYYENTPFPCLNPTDWNTMEFFLHKVLHSTTFINILYEVCEVFFENQDKSLSNQWLILLTFTEYPLRTPYSSLDKKLAQGVVVNGVKSSW